MASTTKIDANLLCLVDKATEEVKDDFGSQKYKNKKDFVDEAVKALLLKEGVVTPEARAA